MHAAPIGSTATISKAKYSRIEMIWVGIRAIGLSLIAFVPLLLINIPQGILFLTKPFAPRIADWSARTAAATYWTYVVWLLVKVTRLEVTIESEPSQLPLGESVVLISNHQSYVDPLVILIIAARQKAIGDLRFFIKDVIKFVPGPGWGMYFLDCIFLKRNWQKDAAHMQKYFNRYKKKIYPTWIQIFPEGTRRTPKKQEATQAYAKEKGRPPLDRVLWPRTKGFTAALEGMGSHLQAVYDATIIYPGNRIPSLLGVFLGEFRSIKVQIQRYPIAALPQTADERSQWMIDRFYHKDKVLGQEDLAFR